MFVMEVVLACIQYREERIHVRNKFDGKADY